MSTNYVRHFNLFGNNIDIPESSHFVMESHRFYLDCINGSDSGEGTQLSPFKTFKRLFEVCANQQADIRCYLISAGSYPVNVESLTGMAIHITSLVAGCYVDFMNTGSGNIQFYGCHVNLQGASADAALNIRNLSETTLPSLYCDGGGHWFKYVNFECAIRFYGCGLLLENCSFNDLELLWSNAKISQCTLKPTYVSDRYTVSGISSLITFSGSNTTFEEPSSVPPSSTPFKFERCSVYFAVSIKITGDVKYSYPFSVDGGVFNTTIKRMESLKTIGSSGASVSNAAIIQNYALLYGIDSTELFTNMTMKGFINNFNVLRLKLKCGDSFYYEDIPNPSYSGSNLNHTFYITDPDNETKYKCNVLLSGARCSWTLNGNGNVRFDSLYGLNV